MPLLPSAMTFSRRATYSERASSSTRVLMSEGKAVRSKLSRLLTVHGLERRRKVHLIGGAEPLIRLIRGAWDLHRGKPSSGELAMFASWDELKAAAKGEKDGAPGGPCAPGSR